MFLLLKVVKLSSFSFFFFFSSVLFLEHPSKTEQLPLTDETNVTYVDRYDLHNQPTFLDLPGAWRLS